MPLTESFTNFFAICKLILKTYQDKNVKAINRDIIFDCFNLYEKTTIKTLAKDHSKYFMSAFERHRIDILADKSNDWIKNDNVYIQLNEGLEKMNPKFKIHLSNIYNRACELTEKANKEFNSLQLNGKHDISSLYPEVAYVDLLIYRFFNLIYDFMEYNIEIIKEEVKQLGKSGDENLTKYISDMKDLKVLITKYEKHMSSNNVKSMIKMPEINIKKETTTTNASPLNLNLQNLNLAEMIKTVTASMGDKNTQGNIGNFVSKITENVKIKNLMNDTLNSLGKSKDPGDAIKSIISDVLPRIPDVIEDVKKDISIDDLPTLNLKTPTEEDIEVKKSSEIDHIVEELDDIKIESTTITETLTTTTTEITHPLKESEESVTFDN